MSKRMFSAAIAMLIREGVARDRVDARQQLEIQLHDSGFSYFSEQEINDAADDLIDQHVNDCS